MRLTLLAAATAAVLPAPVAAQQVKPLLDTRLRYENVDQDGFAYDANALTLRVRGGAEIISGPWSLLAEGEATAAIADSYDSGVNGNTRYPIVGDPANGEINRFQLQYRGFPQTLMTIGRQRINLDDQRFVGAVGWRQNEQTFDAVRLEYSGLEHVKADLTYAWSDRTIWGIDGKGARQQAVRGDNLFANLAYSSPFGTLTGFAYVVDQDEFAVSGFRLSSKTFGLRFAGNRPIGKAAKLIYAASYARQSDHHRNPQDYAADYYLVDGRIEFGGPVIGVGYEVLGADDGRPLTSFQTPLATLHKFQGWADKFLTTPPNGVRDLYVSGGYGWKKIAGFDSVDAGVTWHRFRSDRQGIAYGREWDASLSAKRGRWTALAKLADYNADRLATDTRKVWLELDWAY